MKSIQDIMAQLQERAMKMSLETSNETEKRGVAECNVCNDKEVVFDHADDKGYQIYKPCHCQSRKAWRRRFKNALIPDEFTQATLENYRQETTIQKNMHRLITEYLTQFPLSKKNSDKLSMKNFGFIATIGEQRFRSMSAENRAEVKAEHNNFGIGKTHLQMALSKRLLKQGFHVLVISDVSFMDEMMNAKRMNDGGESFNSLLTGVMNADVLVWDDIGKSKHTEAKESLYYNIINERWKKRKPIVFSTNEDRGTLADHIGGAGASRLIGECGDYLLDTKGEDWRLKKHD